MLISLYAGKKEIERAFVFLAADKLSGKRMEHFALEELTQTLGLLNDCKLIKSSVIYEDPSRNEYGNATKLGKVDVQALRLLYSHLQPGDKAESLRKAFKLYWK